VGAQRSVNESVHRELDCCRRSRDGIFDVDVTRSLLMSES